MCGLGLLSFTLVGVGTASTPRDAQAAADNAPVCRPAVTPESSQSLAQSTAHPPELADLVPQGVGTGGTAGSGPPLNGAIARRAAFPIAAATPKAPTTALVFFSLGARQ